VVNIKFESETNEESQSQLSSGMGKGLTWRCKAQEVDCSYSYVKPRLSQRLVPLYVCLLQKKKKGGALILPKFRHCDTIGTLMPIGAGDASR